MRIIFENDISISIHDEEVNMTRAFQKKIKNDEGKLVKNKNFKKEVEDYVGSFWAESLLS